MNFYGRLNLCFDFLDFTWFIRYLFVAAPFQQWFTLPVRIIESLMFRIRIIDGLLSLIYVSLEKTRNSVYTCAYSLAS
ncbi:hypothetical protein RIF29_41556 [Crotalaria pallida]|uniref:Uncharacterized protein n=1 Tax=Crotalaria pallida TaxID=3830 RepID=A0AAN9E6M4_CROPI